MNRLLDVLREHAASPDEDSAVQPDRDWQLDVNSAVVSMKAFTKKASPDPQTAWQTAVSLRGAVVALGYELRDEGEIGAVSEEIPPYDAPIRRWRGYVRLVFATE